MGALTLERIDDLLSNPLIEELTMPSEQWSRERVFKVRGLGIEYKIEWFCNLSHLTVSSSDMQINFDEMKIGRTWPNMYKTSIHFIFCGEVCCILPIEAYNG